MVVDTMIKELCFYFLLIVFFVCYIVFVFVSIFLKKVKSLGKKKEKKIVWNFENYHYKKES